MAAVAAAATTAGTAAPVAPTPFSVAAPISAAVLSMAASATSAAASVAAASSAAAVADDGVPRYYREDTDGDGGDSGAGAASGRPAVANTEGIPLLTTRAGPPIPAAAAAEDGGVVGVVTGLMSYLLSRPPAPDATAGAAGTPAAAAAAAADAASNWEARLKEEYRALIVYIKRCAAADAAWVKVAATGKDGVNWVGTCWWYHNNLRYEFVLQLEVRWCGLGVLRCVINAQHTYTPLIPVRCRFRWATPPCRPSSSCRSCWARRPRCTRTYLFAGAAATVYARPHTTTVHNQSSLSMQRRPHLPQHPLLAAVALQGTIVWHCTRAGTRVGAVAVH